MEQVTRLEEKDRKGDGYTGLSDNQVTNAQNDTLKDTLNELPFDPITLKVLAGIKLDSKSAVFSGLNLLETYYRKLHKNKQQPKKSMIINLYLFGTVQTMLESFNKLLDDLTKSKKFGSSIVYDMVADEYTQVPYNHIEIFLQGLKAIVKISFVDCRTALEVLNLFESGNEMMYWAHDTGLVVTPFAKIGMETNQVVPNFKDLLEISNQTLIELKKIGFDISNYVKSAGFVKNNELDHGIVYEKLFLNLNDEFSVEKYLVSIAKYKNCTFTQLNEPPSKLNLTHRQRIYLPHPENKSHEHNCLILTGQIKQLVKVEDDVYIIFGISDEQIATNILDMIRFCCNNSCTNNIDVTCIINSNYLKPEDKCLSRHWKYLPNELYKLYEKDNSLCIICEFDSTIEITNTKTNTNFINYKLNKSGDEKCIFKNINNIGNSIVNVWCNFYVDTDNYKNGALCGEIRLIMC